MRAKSSKAIDLLLARLLSLIPAVAGADTLERVRSSHSVVIGYVPDFARCCASSRVNIDRP
jgi:polar amino acid transport system substrate-binding protein